MEFITIIIIGLVINWVFNLMKAGGKAAVDTARGRGTLSDNLNLQLQGMGPLELRVVEGRLGDDGEGPLSHNLQVRGLFPITSPCDVGFFTSVFDVTEGGDRLVPVISIVDWLQEENGIAFQCRRQVGVARPDQGYASWVDIGILIPEGLQPPRSGRRKLLVIVRMVDMRSPPDITNGFRDEGDLVLWYADETIEHTFESHGWEEASERRERAQALAIRIGVAVAMSDGELHEDEGQVLKDWMRRVLFFYDDDRRDQLKETFNTALRIGYERAQKGEQVLSELVSEMNEQGGKADKYEAVELCFDVMAADGVADEAELSLIRKLAEALDLDFDEVENMRDKKMVELDISLSDQGGLDEMLGIDRAWDADKRRRHLRQEFQKWNNRLNALPEGEERENAQRMLDAIAEYRKTLDRS
jgi:tellurite resistance protein